MKVVEDEVIVRARRQRVERKLVGDADGSSQLGCTLPEHSQWQCSQGPPWTWTGPTLCGSDRKGRKLLTLV